MMQSIPDELTSNQLGIWGEHVAAAWFIKHGYNVLFPRSTQHRGYDFLVEKNSNASRVQVKTGANYRGNVPRVNCKIDKSQFDMLFVLHYSGLARLYTSSDAVCDVKFTDEMNNKKNKFTITL